jgi:hypothetical protein
MRVLGAVLLVVGFLLCLSIVWAAPGFFMMGAGLISLLVAEQRTKRAQLVIEPKGVFVSGEATNSVNYDPRQSSDYRAQSLRALYEATADNAALMRAAEPTDRDSKPVLPGRFSPDRNV